MIENNFSDQKKRERIIKKRKEAQKRYRAGNPRVCSVFTAEEYQEFCHQAEARGLSASSFLKKLAYLELKCQQQYIPTKEEIEAAAPPSCPLSPEQEALLKKVQDYVRSIAYNINQIAHVANVYQRPDAIDNDKIQTLLANLERVILAFCRGQLQSKEEAYDNSKLHETRSASGHPSVDQVHQSSGESRFTGADDSL